MEQPDGKPEAAPNGDVPDVLPSNFNKGSYSPGYAVSPVSRDALFYKMDHRRRGIALIFNHEHFTISTLKSRTGTGADRENLEQTLIHLGFEVTVYNDKKTYEVEDLVQKASEADHSECDGFLLAVLSHGEEGILYGYDSAYKPDMLWSKFTPDKCPTLAGKPKLFFIQACQGDRLDGGIKVKTQVDSNSSSPFKIPLHADFLIAYSTIPGYYSWRNTAKGSWFMQALCMELRESGFNYDLLTLLTFVNRRVALDFESYVPGDYRMHAQKQIPCITYMLTRLLRFKHKV